MNTSERRATAGLWSIQGIGPVTLAQIRKRLGPLGELLEQPPAAWASFIEWKGEAYERLMALPCLGAAADAVERACQAHGARILFAGDPAFPSRLETLRDAPPLLFVQGPAADAPPRRRLAIVGTRTLVTGLTDRVRHLAAEAARCGLCIVSGAARGTDQAAHWGTLDAGGETWAFMGCALDQIDERQLAVCQAILAAKGTLLSEYPPGFRANLNSFKLRNRLISGASDAVLVVRAPEKSGALYTAEAAEEQGRPLLVTPSDPWDVTATGSNELLRQGKARLHLDLGDLLDAVGLTGSMSPPEPIAVDVSQLSAPARALLDRLRRGGADFEALQGALPAFTSAELSGALVELEVFGAVLHKGGRRYEKR